MSIPVASFLVPKNSNTWFVLEDIFIKGGFRCVLDTVARNSIDVANLKSGMLVFTQSDRKIWQLGADLVTWSEAVLGGGGVAAPGGITIPNCTLDRNTPNSRLEFMSTNPNGWNLADGKMTVDYCFISNSFFAYNPSAHAATVLRQDPATNNTSVTGNGVIMGNLLSASFGVDAALSTPTMMLETWDPLKTPTQRWIFGQTTGARNRVLVDGIKYRVIVDSTVQRGVRYIRYRLYRFTGSSINAWDLENDTGDVLDHNSGADFTKSGFMFGAVFLENLGTWSINFSNISITWGPTSNPASDMTAKLSKFGADLDGDLSFLSSGKTIRFPANPGPSLLESLTFQTSTPNAATTLVVKPNGTSKIANILFSDNSYSTTTYKCVYIGMSNGRGQIATLSTDGSTPPVDIVLGGVTVATFSKTGLKLLANSAEIGSTRIRYASTLTNFGGYNANLHNTANTLNIDSICTVGTIASFMSPAPSNAQVETVLRPLYCMFSELVSDLRAKGLI